MTAAFLSNVDSDTRFILEAEFTESIVLKYRVGGVETEYPTTCIFDETYETIDPETGAPVLSNYSRATVWEKKIETDVLQKIKEDENDNWRAEIRNVDYFIKHVERDGFGIALMDLKRV